MRKAKFEVKDMLTIGLIFVVTGIAIGYGLNIQGDIKEEMCNDDFNYYDNECYVCPPRYNLTYTTFNSSKGYCYNSTGNESPAVVVRPFEFNSSIDASQGIAKIPEKMPLIATVVVAAIIIGIILRYLVFRG